MNNEALRVVAGVADVIHDALGIRPRPNFRPFVYVGVGNFADAATVGSEITFGITTESDSDFVCQAVTVSTRVDDNGRFPTSDDDDGASELGGVPDPAILMQIREGTGDRLWHNEPVDALAVYGALSPKRGLLGWPRLLKGNTTVNFTCSVLKAAAAGTGFDVRVHLVGFKVPKGQLAG